MSEGWVRLYRKIDENPLWFMEPFTKAQAWIDLFLNANHTDGKFLVRGNVVNIKRGQIGWSELTMAKRWTWSKGKVRRFLKYLEIEQQITTNKLNEYKIKTVQQNSFEIGSKQGKNDTADNTTTSPYITTIITIINYEKYQSDTADDTADGQQNDRKRYINKNDNNNNNEKNISSQSSDKLKPSELAKQRTDVINRIERHLGRKLKGTKESIRGVGDRVLKEVSLIAEKHNDNYQGVLESFLEWSEKQFWWENLTSAGKLHQYISDWSKTDDLIFGKSKDGRLKVLDTLAYEIYLDLESVKGTKEQGKVFTAIWDKYFNEAQEQKVSRYSYKRKIISAGKLVGFNFYENN